MYNLKKKKKHSEPQVLCWAPLTTERHSPSPPGAHELVGDKNKQVQSLVRVLRCYVAKKKTKTKKK